MKNYIYVISMTFLSLSLSGCIAAAVGAGAGYWATKKESQNQKTIENAKVQGAQEQAQKDK